MTQYAKEFGLLWAFCVSCVLINAADERGRRLLLDEGQGLHSVNMLGNNNNNFGLSPINNGSTLLLGLGGHICESYPEYKELVQLENDLECHSLDTAFAKLRALHDRSLQGPGCMHDVIGKFKTYISSHHDSFNGCTCSGHVLYHPERYHNERTKSKDKIEPTCRERLFHWRAKTSKISMPICSGTTVIPVPVFQWIKAEILLSLFWAVHARSDFDVGRRKQIQIWSRFSSLPIHLDTFLDCQWEIIKHYTTILDANGPRCICRHGSMNIHSTPPHTDSMSTTMSPTTSENTPFLTELAQSNIRADHPNSALIRERSVEVPNSSSVPNICMKTVTISTLGHGIKQMNLEAGNCHPETNDHEAPEALVMNMCSVSSHSETWTRGQNVVSVCEKIPLYTPVATFFDGKYSNQGGLAGIFVGCLLDGFKMIVQECDKNITVMHLVTGGHFQLDPVNYSIIM